MLVSFAAMIGGEVVGLKPGDAYEPVSADEAKRLYDAGFAAPFDGWTPALIAAIAPPSVPNVSPETLPTSGSLVTLPDGLTITPATDRVEPGETEAPGQDDPTDAVVEEAKPVEETKPAAAAAKPKRTRKNSAK